MSRVSISLRFKKQEKIKSHIAYPAIKISVDELPKIEKRKTKSQKIDIVVGGRGVHKDVKREVFFFKSYIRGRKSCQARKTFRNNVVVHGGGQPMKRIETLR